MASKILIKRSTTAGAIPTAQQLSTGELAINLTDRKIYTNDNGIVKELGILPTTLNVTNNATVGGTFGVSGVSTLASGSVTGNFTVGGTLTVAVPSNNTDAASKGYVDTAVAGVLDSAPELLDTLNELAAAINDDPNFYNTITGLISEKVAKAGDTMTGDLVMGINKVTTTSNPVSDNDLARKGYVDTILGSAQEAETSATQAATSATNAANSASAASTSASQASSSATSASSSATSATASASSASSSAASASSSATASATSASEASTSAANAESAWDSFDDRYLGAKATDPTVDNDGNALVVGAMYFDSTNNVTKLYNGTEWQAASSSIDGIKTDFVYTATAGQTVFSGNDDNTNELVIDKVGLANVYLNGVRLSDSDYTASAPSNSITLSTGASVGDSVEVEVFGNFAGQSGADVAITGGSITGVTLNATSFTSTGIDDNATSTAITIDANENVLIGTTSTSWLTADGLRLFDNGSLTATGSDIIQLGLNRRGSDGEIINFRKDGTTVGSIGTTSDALDITGKFAGGIAVSYENTTNGLIAPITLTGAFADGLHNLGRSNARFKDLYLSGGVYLGGTGSANKLDDYEEGVWTPTVSTTGTAPTIGTYSNRVGIYTKVGNVVHLACFLRFTCPSSGSGDIIITGLPFNSTGNLEGIGTGLVGALTNRAQGTSTDTYVNTSTVYLTNDTLRVTSGSGEYITFSCSYRTTA